MNESTLKDNLPQEKSSAKVFSFVLIGLVIVLHGCAFFWRREGVFRCSQLSALVKYDKNAKRMTIISVGDQVFNEAGAAEEVGDDVYWSRGKEDGFISFKLNRKYMTLRATMAGGVTNDKCEWVAK